MNVEGDVVVVASARYLKGSGQVLDVRTLFHNCMHVDVHFEFCYISWKSEALLVVSGSVSLVS